MTSAAAHARHLSLLRFEQAAGEAFGCPVEAEPLSRPSLFLTPTTIAFTTVATAVVATIGYLV